MNIIQALSLSLMIVFILFLTHKKNIGNFWIRKQKFKCTRCGKCCRYLVKLGKEDIDRIKKAGHTNFIKYRKKIPYLKQINGLCTFLKIEKGKAECTIYNHRPEICRNFPRVKAFGEEAWDSRSNAFEVPLVFRSSK